MRLTLRDSKTDSETDIKRQQDTYTEIDSETDIEGQQDRFTEIVNKQWGLHTFQQ